MAASPVHTLCSPQVPSLTLASQPHPARTPGRAVSGVHCSHSRFPSQGDLASVAFSWPAPYLTTPCIPGGPAISVGQGAKPTADHRLVISADTCLPLQAGGWFLNIWGPFITALQPLVKTKSLHAHKHHCLCPSVFFSYWDYRCQLSWDSVYPNLFPSLHLRGHVSPFWRLSLPRDPWFHPNSLPLSQNSLPLTINWLHGLTSWQTEVPPPCLTLMSKLPTGIGQNCGSTVYLKLYFPNSFPIGLLDT